MPPSAFRAARSLRAPLLVSLLLAVVLGACGSGPAPTTFDLSAPRDFGRAGGSRAALVINLPTATQPLDSDRVIVKDSSGAVSFVGGVQWAQSAPGLIQTRLLQTFENGSWLGSVSRPGDRIVPDLQLATDIRSFNIEAGSNTAVVEITARVIGDRDGRVRKAKMFTARVPGSTDGPAAAQALDRALSQVLVDIVRWTGGARG